MYRSEALVDGMLRLRGLSDRVRVHFLQAKANGTLDFQSGEFWIYIFSKTSEIHHDSDENVIICESMFRNLLPCL